MKSIPVHLKHISVLSLVWLVGMFIVGVQGDFPLNDDWAYGQNVFQLTENGQFKLSDWPAMTFIAQQFWGSLFCLIFGFSFSILRISTLILGWIGILAFYFWCLEINKQNGVPFLMSLLLLVNPFYFSLSYTFMTDVPFLSCSVLATLFFSRALKEDIYFSRNLILGLVFLLIATMIRQLGLLVGLYYLVGFLLLKKLNLKNVFRAILPLLFVTTVLVLFLKWLERIDQLPEAFTKYGSVAQLFDVFSNGQFVQNLAFRPGVLLYYMGWFFLPFMVLNLKTISKNVFKNWVGLLSLVATAGILFFFRKIWYYVPKGGFIDHLKIGPTTMKGTETFDPTQLPQTTDLFIFRLAGLLGGALVVLVLLNKVIGWIRQRRRLSKNPEAALQFTAWFIAGCYFVFLLMSPFFFDRYYLYLFPFVALAILPIEKQSVPKPLWVFSFLCLLPYCWFSFAGTHDFLERNRTRWTALNHLTNEQNITPNRIDGGFEFNGWHSTYVQRPILAEGQPSWWFVDRDDYVVTLKPIKNFQVEEILNFSQYIPFKRDSIYILKRPEPHRIDRIATDLERFSLTEKRIQSTLEGVEFSGTESLIDTFSRSGKYAIVLDEQQAFSLSHTFKGVAPGDRFIAKLWFYGPTRKSCLFVFTDPGGESLYKRGHFNTIKEPSGWELGEFELVIPENYAKKEIQFYVWNSKHQPVFVDDLEISWLKARPVEH